LKFQKFAEKLRKNLWELLFFAATRMQNFFDFYFFSCSHYAYCDDTVELALLF